MGDPMQDATDAMTRTEPVYPMPPTELVKGFNILDTKRQVELLAYLEELCEEQMLHDWQLLEKQCCVEQCVERRVKQLAAKRARPPGTAAAPASG